MQEILKEKKRSSRQVEREPSHDSESRDKVDETGKFNETAFTVHEEEPKHLRVQ